MGKYFPEFGATLEVGIQIGLFFMIYLVMTKIDISELKKAVESQKQTSIIVFFNCAVNLFLLFALGYVFFEALFPSLGLMSLETGKYLWIGLILIGIAPCIALVLVWTELKKLLVVVPI